MKKFYGSLFLASMISGALGMQGPNPDQVDPSAAHSDYTPTLDEDVAYGTRYFALKSFDIEKSEGSEKTEASNELDVPEQGETKDLTELRAFEQAVYDSGVLYFLSLYTEMDPDFKALLKQKFDRARWTHMLYQSGQSDVSSEEWRDQPNFEHAHQFAKLLENHQGWEALEYARAKKELWLGLNSLINVEGLRGCQQFLSSILGQLDEGLLSGISQGICHDLFNPLFKEEDGSPFMTVHQFEQRACPVKISWPNSLALMFKSLSKFNPYPHDPITHIYNYQYTDFRVLYDNLVRYFTSLGRHMNQGAEDLPNTIRNLIQGKVRKWEVRVRALLSPFVVTGLSSDKEEGSEASLGPCMEEYSSGTHIENLYCDGSPLTAEEVEADIISALQTFEDCWVKVANTDRLFDEDNIALMEHYSKIDSWGSPVQKKLVLASFEKMSQDLEGKLDKGCILWDSLVDSVIVPTLTRAVYTAILNQEVDQALDLSASQKFMIQCLGHYLTQADKPVFLQSEILSKLFKEFPLNIVRQFQEHLGSISKPELYQFHNSAQNRLAELGRDILVRIRAAKRGEEEKPEAS